MSPAVTIGLIFVVSVLVDVALHHTSPTGDWPSAEVVFVIVGVVGAAVLGVRWALNRVRSRAAAPAGQAADRVE